MIKFITYSPAVSLALTRNCNNRCLYCGFRDEGAGLVSINEIESKAELALRVKASEVLLISGENVNEIPEIKEGLKKNRIDSFIDFTERACNYFLDRGLLPHINIGLLERKELARLKSCCASMGLMMEGDYGAVSTRVQPQKIFEKRLLNLKWAGQLKIPFTTGLLIGIGETWEDRKRSVTAIATMQDKYGHVQEIIIQPYIRSSKSSLAQSAISMNDIKDLAEQVLEEMPGVHLQFPPNLFKNWLDLLELGFDDLGGIGFDDDLVNPGSKWPSVYKIKESLEPNIFKLRKRLPLYSEFYARGWYSNRVGEVITGYVENDNGYKYYTE